MKKIFSYHFICRISPLLILLVQYTIESFCVPVRPSACHTCCYLLFALTLVQFYPLSYEKLRTTLFFLSVFSLYGCIASYFVAGGGRYDLLILFPCVLSLSVFIVVRKVELYADIISLFRKDSAWSRLEHDSREVYTLCVPVLSFIIIVAGSFGAGTVFYRFLAILEAILYATLHWRAYTGYTMIVSAGKEGKIRNLITAELNGYIDPEVVDDDLLAGIYRRLQVYMQTRKPFLDENLSLDHIAAYLRVNKGYISKAVNRFAKKNIRQYINYYRVLYSVEIMKRRPGVKVIELAFESGFHSVVTYSMAFKLFMNKTPGDMLARLRLSFPVPELSRHGEVVFSDPADPSAQDGSR